MVFVPHGGYDADRDKGWFVADYFVPEGDRWRRFTERIEQVWWTPAEIEAALTDTGFVALQRLDLGDLTPGVEAGMERGCTDFYLVRKT